jgi:SAM-dependent methyltransferase
MLAKALPSHEIIGGDINERAIAHAKARHGGPANLSYRSVDLGAWNDLRSWQALGAFDHIVCFDVIEHMLHREILLMNLAENLSPDGLLLLSTPSGRRESLLNPGWERNKIEYSHKHLYNLMRRFFGEVMIPDNETLPELSFWQDVINGKEQHYLLRGTPMVCARPVVLGFDHF